VGAPGGRAEGSVPYRFCRPSWADADALAALVASPGVDRVAEADEITKW
jgi:hypothetical protein